jgi:hypothetical protein
MLMKLLVKTMTSRVGCLAIGAGAMYLADPDRGRSRRVQMTQRAEGLVRRNARHMVRRTEAEQRYLMGRLEGVMAQARGRGQFHPESEVDLREHLRQVIRSLPVKEHLVNVDVCGGVVTLRGEVADEEQRARLLDAVRRVQGVGELKDLTHLPGQPAPNKEAPTGP